LFINKKISQLLLALFLLQPFIVFANKDTLINQVDVSIHQAKKMVLAEHDTWKSLLHIKDGAPQIVDPEFLLSGTRFSLEAELAQTIELYYQDPASFYCRFPARLLFLKKYLNLQGQASARQCIELEKYKQYVPFDDVSLVFASEVLSSASSMMGHTFLKVSGKNKKNNDVAHSISFFTEITTFNPIKLIYEGVFTGMEGFILVRPYKNDLKRYSETEGRNVWTYSLDLTEFDKQLIQAHTWELKNIEIKYLFQHYNCATLTLYLLSIAKPELQQSEKLYVSPVDVVKAVSQYELVKTKEVVLATDWRLNMLSQQMPASLLEVAYQLIEGKGSQDLNSLDQTEKYLLVEYLSALIEKSSHVELLSEQTVQRLRLIVDAIDIADMALDISAYKNPIESSQDSVITSAFRSIDGSPVLDFSFLPASHYLYGNNTQYFSESELNIGELTLRADIEKKDLKIQNLTLYAVRSYLPSTRYSVQTSGQFYLGYRHLYNESLKQRGVLELSGGFGKSYALHKDVTVYAMLGFGLGITEKEAFGFYEPSVGAFINLIGDSKLMVNYQSSYNQFDIDGAKNTVSVDYSWFGAKNTTIKLGYKKTAVGNIATNELSLLYGYHF
jgi:hypothetical protein